MPDTTSPRVFWAVLLERALIAEPVSSIINVAMSCGKLGYTRIDLPFMVTDQARNGCVGEFLKASTSPDDVLVMLDNDHLHPINIVHRLASYPFPVIGALAFRRGDACDPLVFVRLPSGEMASIAQWTPGDIVQCDMVAPCAIAIKRSVFDRFKEMEFEPPYYRYQYRGGRRMSEDMSFGELCEKAGVAQYCDTGLVIPHVATATIDDSTWYEYLKQHPDAIKTIELGEEKKE